MKMEMRHTALTQFLAALRAELARLPLTAEDRMLVQSDIETIEAQLASSRPQHAILTAAVRVTKDMLSHSAVSDAVSEELVALMHRLPV